MLDWTEGWTEKEKEWSDHVTIRVNYKYFQITSIGFYKCGRQIIQNPSCVAENVILNLTIRPKAGSKV